MELNFINCQANAEYRYHVITDLLHQHVCIVDFVKVNGELRSMPCTLQDNVLPAPSQILKEAVVGTPINYEIITAWCTDVDGWRSMKTMNITGVRLFPGKWTVTLEEDETGNLVLPLPEDLLKVKGWQEGDVLNWQDNKDGTWNLTSDKQITGKAFES